MGTIYALWPLLYSSSWSFLTAIKNCKNQKKKKIVKTILSSWEVPKEWGRGLCGPRMLFADPDLEPVTSDRQQSVAQWLRPACSAESRLSLGHDVAFRDFSRSFSCH